MIYNFSEIVLKRWIVKLIGNDVEKLIAFIGNRERSWQPLVDTICFGVVRGLRTKGFCLLIRYVHRI